MKTENTDQIIRLAARDFKSIEHFDIDVQPLTVIVGKNSAGKSSFIQSLLLVVQHFSSDHSSDKQISLNQHLTRLGTFEQAHRRGSSDSAVTVEIETPSHSWKVEFVEFQDRPRSNYASIRTISGARKHDGDSYSFVIQNIRPFDLQLPVVGVSLDRPTSAAIDMRSVCRADVEIRLGDDPPLITASYVYVGEAHRQMYPAALMQTDFFTYLAKSLGYNVTGGPRRSAARTSDALKGSRGLVSRTAAALADMNSVKQSERLVEDLRQFVSTVCRTVFTDDSVSEFARIVHDSLNATSESLTSHTQSKIDGISQIVTSWYRALENQFMRSYVQLLSQTSLRKPIFDLEDTTTSQGQVAIKEAIVECFYATLKRLSPSLQLSADDISVLVPALTVLSADAAIEQNELANIAYFLGDFPRRIKSSLSGVYYVGPIRDIEYPADPISNPLYVGRRGEQSIEILQREADRSVVDPETGESVRFADALARALRRFELGEDVVVEERGRERAGLSVAGTNSETDEVNAVGVGVGQVLPVLMQCILGKPNASTVVIEQPELHLHPRLEQEMADFFIDCIQTGRRLIIETHSEHLINRLRLRIAEDDANELAPKIKILFAEKSPMGITHFREPTINKYGAIEEDWPEGFLDLSVKESSELLDKAVKRRRAELESRRQELDAKYGSRESEQK